MTVSRIYALPSCYGMVPGGHDITVDGLASALADGCDEPAIVVARILDINDHLADVLYASGPGNVGIIPVGSSTDGSRVAELLGVATPVSRDAARICVYSVEEDDLEVNPPSAGANGIEVITVDHRSVTNHLRSGQLTAFVGVMNGRQTFCYLGKRVALHPGLPTPQAGVVSAPDVQCAHWFLQSCHSPFTWPDFGQYLTLPQAILLRGNARTVIASTGVQTLIPGAAREYVEMAADGTTAGAIVQRLNNLARSLGIDDRPFVLFGNPAERIVAPGAEHRTPRIKAEATSQRLIRSADVLGGLDALIDIHLRRRADCKKYVRSVTQRLDQFSHDAHRLRSDVSPSPDGEDLADVLGRQVPSIDLRQLSKELCEVWRAGKGYYYTYSDDLEGAYAPVDSRVTDARCPSCASVLREKRLRCVRPRAIQRTSLERTRSVCPRCLIVADGTTAVALHTEFRKEGDRAVASITYVNRTRDPQWVMAVSWLSDPNNVSVRTAKRVSKELLAPLQAAHFDETPRTLHPEEQVRWELDVGGIGADLFYLLFEAHVFVNFTWSWRSWTWRAPAIERWLASAMYRRSLETT